MRGYAEQIKKYISEASEEKIPPKFYVYGINNDYSEILKRVDSDKCVLFVDGYRHVWQGFGDFLQVSSMRVIYDVIKRLPKDYASHIVIDSIDQIPGSLLDVCAACIGRNVDLHVVAGVNQKGGFYNFGRLIEEYADEIWIEKRYRKMNRKEATTESIYEQALSRAAMRCEYCGEYAHELEMHHILSGKGRRKQQERVETVAMLCYTCHRSEQGIHGRDGSKIDLDLKKRLQQYYFSQELSEQDVRTLMGGKLY